eukprot:6566047-Prorocentrum_lima.AAC.1
MERHLRRGSAQEVWEATDDVSEPYRVRLRAWRACAGRVRAELSTSFAGAFIDKRRSYGAPPSSRKRTRGLGSH